MLKGCFEFFPLGRKCFNDDWNDLLEREKLTMQEKEGKKLEQYSTLEDRGGALR